MYANVGQMYAFLYTLVRNINIPILLLIMFAIALLLQLKNYLIFRINFLSNYASSNTAHHEEQLKGNNQFKSSQPTPLLS